eukprot:Pgem_evm1s6874
MTSGLGYCFVQDRATGLIHVLAPQTTTNRTTIITTIMRIQLSNNDKLVSMVYSSQNQHLIVATKNQIIHYHIELELTVSLSLFQGKKLMTKGLFTKPSPFCAIAVGDNKYKTKAKTKTANPIWDQTFNLVGVSNKTDIRFNLFHNGVGVDMAMGTSLLLARTLISDYFCNREKDLLIKTELTVSPAGKEKGTGTISVAYTCTPYVNPSKLAQYEKALYLV